MGCSQHIICLAQANAYGWGNNGGGQVGDSTTTMRLTPTLVTGGISFAKIACGATHTIGLTADGIPYAWGYNDRGQLGDNTATASSTPRLIVGNHSFTDIAAGSVWSMFLKEDGSAWACGGQHALIFVTWSNSGQLGDETVTERSSPVLVHGNHSFVAISAGSHTAAALKEDGSAWTWGYNYYGVLGDGTQTSKSSPVSVIGNHSFVEIRVGYMFMLARKADGTLWGWGRNNVGSVGDNTIIDKSSPVLVVGGVFTEFDAGGYYNGTFSVAIKSDGSAWRWGSSAIFGGTGAPAISSATLLTGNHQFVSVYTTAYSGIGHKSDGQVWSWGLNGDTGIIGDGQQYTDRESPVLVFNTGA